jgi:hypothetical protein
MYQQQIDGNMLGVEEAHALETLHLNFERIWPLALMLLLILLFLTTQASEAQQIAKASIRGDLASLQPLLTGNLARSSHTFRPLAAPARALIDLPLQGRATLMLRESRVSRARAEFVTAQGRVPDVQRIIHLKGTMLLARGGSEVPVAATLHGDDSRLEVFFTGSQGASDQSHDYFHLTGNLQASELRVDRTPQHVTHSLFCGADEAVDTHSDAISGRHPTRGVIFSRENLYLELAAEADYEFYLRHGAKSNAMMEALINAASIIYKRDLGIALESTVLSTHTTPDAYTTDNPAGLLQQFQHRNAFSHQLDSADVYHLFTGKELEGDIIGFAYVGVTCYNSAFSYGLSQRYSSSVDYLVLAHELGHNLGAGHDASESLSLMSPNIGPGQDYFSNTSLGQIAGFLDDYGSCLTSSVSSVAGGRGPPIVTLEASLGEDAVLNATATLSKQGRDSCSLVLLASDSAKLRRTMTLGSTPGKLQQVKFRASTARSPRKQNQLYLRAEYHCPDSTISKSDVLRVQTAKSPRKTKPYPSLRAYLQALKAAVSIEPSA